MPEVKVQKRTVYSIADFFNLSRPFKNRPEGRKKTVNLMLIISSYFNVYISCEGSTVTKESFTTLMAAKRFASRFASDWSAYKKHLTTYRIEVKYSDGDEAVVETGGFKNGKEFEF